MTDNPSRPPAGYTWDGSLDDIADRLTFATDGDTKSLAAAATVLNRALGSVAALAKSPSTGTEAQRLHRIARICEAVDLIETRSTR